MRYAKHFDKDLYSRWHRKYESIAMVDVDSVECCYNKGCWQPLALIETVYDTGNYVKYTNVTRWIAKSCHIPAYLVFYKNYMHCYHQQQMMSKRMITPLPASRSSPFERATRQP